MTDTDKARFVVGVEKPTKADDTIRVELLGPDENVLMANYDEQTMNASKNRDVRKDVKDVSTTFYGQTSHSAEILDVTETDNTLEATVSVNDNKYTVTFNNLYV